MNILIFGASGLLGHNLIQELAEGGHNLFVISRSLNDYNGLNNITVVQQDLNNLNLSQISAKIDMVYYLAQSRNFRDIPKSTMDIFEINVHVPIKIAQWSITNGVKKFVYASSGGVYANSTQYAQESSVITTNLKNGFYLDSKLSAEIFLRNYSVYFETFIILRPFFIYGPGQNETMLIPRLFNNIKQGKPIQIHDPEGIVINPIYSSDAAKLAAKLTGFSGEHTINLAGSEQISIQKLANKIGVVVGRSPVFEINNNSQPNLIADISNMINILGKPEIMLDYGLKLYNESI